MTDIRRKLIEHEIIKYKELREMFEKKAKTFRKNSITGEFRGLIFNYYYSLMVMNMWEKELDWKDLLRRQQ